MSRRCGSYSALYKDQALDDECKPDSVKTKISRCLQVSDDTTLDGIVEMLHDETGRHKKLGAQRSIDLVRRYRMIRGRDTKMEFSVC